MKGGGEARSQASARESASTSKLCLCMLRKGGIKEEREEGREKCSDTLFIILNWHIK